MNVTFIMGVISSMSWVVILMQWALAIISLEMKWTFILHIMIYLSETHDKFDHQHSKILSLRYYFCLTNIRRNY
jgi:hypothetical protein